MSKKKSNIIINRKCIVCGKRIRIVLYDDRHYRNGYYFGIMKVPVGKGEYKKVGESRLLGKSVNVVKWTGKEKEMEYWECNSCYEESQHEAWLEETLERIYGKKCLDYEKLCFCCQAWGVYDSILDFNRGRL